MTVLELAVRFGKVLIIQEVDQIEPILFPLLKKDLSLQGEIYDLAKRSTLSIHTNVNSDINLMRKVMTVVALEQLI